MNISRLLRAIQFVALGVVLGGGFVAVWRFSRVVDTIVAIERSHHARALAMEAARSALSEAGTALDRCCLSDGPFRPGASFPRINWRKALQGLGSDEELLRPAKDRFVPFGSRKGLPPAVDIGAVSLECLRLPSRAAHSQGVVALEVTVRVARPATVVLTLRSRHSYRATESAVSIEPHAFARCANWREGAP